MLPKDSLTANKKDRILVVSANLGALETSQRNHAPQMSEAIEVNLVNFSDANFPPRYLAMSSRLQAKIPKMLAWEYFPGYDYYLWLDGSFTILASDSIEVLYKLFKDQSIGLVDHPDRRSISAELDFMKIRMSRGDSYLLKRYSNEWIEAQVGHYINSIQGFKDTKLFAAGLFLYRNPIAAMTERLFRDWFYHCCRYSVQDQLSLPPLLHEHNVAFKSIPFRETEKYFRLNTQQRTRIA